jgi:hypothetical protein
MPYTRAQRKRVYIEWKRIFSSFDNTRLRKAKAIRTVVQRHRPYSEQFNPDLVGIVKSLLEEGVFEWRGDSKAREIFPELFETLPTETKKETVPRLVTAKTMFETAHQSEAHKRLLRSLEQ